MKIESLNITVNLIKGASFVAGIMVLVWKVSALTLGVQQGIDSRFEQLENKVEIVLIKQTSQYQLDRNMRKRDSADISIKLKGQDQKLDFILSSVNRMSPYTQRPLSSN